MLKLASIVVFLTLVVPFVLVFDAQFTLQFVQVMVIVAFFYLGALATFTRRPVMRRPVDYSLNAVGLGALLVLFAVIYAAFRVEYIIDFAESARRGGLFYTVQSAAISRYENLDSVSITYQLGSVAFFVFCGLAGAQKASKDIFLQTISIHVLLALMVLIEISDGSRSRAVIGLVFYAVEWIIRNNARLHRMSISKYGVYGSLCAIIGCAIFFVPQFARVYQSTAAIEIVLLKASSYTIAPYEGLLRWLSIRDTNELAMGNYTFGSLFRPFGVDPPSDFYQFVPTRFGRTNILTAIRGWVGDFGFLGACIFSFLLSILIRRASLGKLGAVNTCLGRGALIMILYFMYSPFYFTSALLSFLAICIIVDYGQIRQAALSLFSYGPRLAGGTGR